MQLRDRIDMSHSGWHLGVMILASLIFAIGLILLGQFALSQAVHGNPETFERIHAETSCNILETELTKFLLAEREIDPDFEPIKARAASEYVEAARERMQALRC